VSLGSIVGITTGLLVCIVLIAFGQIPLGFLPWAVVCGGLVVIVHHDNIQRLLSGTERKFGQHA